MDRRSGLLAVPSNAAAAQARDGPEHREDASWPSDPSYGGLAEGADRRCNIVPNLITA